MRALHHRKARLSHPAQVVEVIVNPCVVRVNRTLRRDSGESTAVHRDSQASDAEDDSENEDETDDGVDSGHGDGDTGSDSNLDCEDFDTQEEAQEAYEQDPSDPNRLDDDDVACEVLPDESSASLTTSATDFVRSLFV